MSFQGIGGGNNSMNNLSSSNSNNSDSRSNTASPSVSIIDINTKAASPGMINNNNNASLPDALRNKFPRHMTSGPPISATGGGGAIKPILPKPHTTSTNTNSLFNLASSVPNTLAGILNSAPNGPNNGRDVAGALGARQPTGFGPHGPTISVKQLIAEYKRDNPATPPVR